MAEGGITGKGFKKGDARINRKGRPRSFDALRDLAQQIAHETVKAGGVEVTIDGHKITVTEAILRQWAQSKNPQLQKGFLEIAFGKVPDRVDFGGKVTLDFTKYTDEQLLRIIAGDDPASVLSD